MDPRFRSHGTSSSSPHRITHQHTSTYTWAHTTVQVLRSMLHLFPRGTVMGCASIVEHISSVSTAYGKTVQPRRQVGHAQTQLYSAQYAYFQWLLWVLNGCCSHISVKISCNSHRSPANGRCSRCRKQSKARPEARERMNETLVYPSA